MNIIPLKYVQFKENSKIKLFVSYPIYNDNYKWKNVATWHFAVKIFY